MTDSEIIEALGGTGAVARLCEVEGPSVSEWKRNNRIPKARRMYLELLRPDVFAAAAGASQGDCAELGKAA